MFLISSHRLFSAVCMVPAAACSNDKLITENFQFTLDRVIPALGTLGEVRKFFSSESEPATRNERLIPTARRLKVGHKKGTKPFNTKTKRHYAEDEDDAVVNLGSCGLALIKSNSVYNFERNAACTALTMNGLEWAQETNSLQV